MNNPETEVSPRSGSPSLLTGRLPVVIESRGDEWIDSLICGMTQFNKNCKSTNWGFKLTPSRTVFVAPIYMSSLRGTTCRPQAKDRLGVRRTCLIGSDAGWPARIDEPTPA